MNQQNLWIKLETHFISSQTSTPTTKMELQFKLKRIQDPHSQECELTNEPKYINKMYTPLAYAFYQHFCQGVRSVEHAMMKCDLETENDILWNMQNRTIEHGDIIADMNAINTNNQNLAELIQKLKMFEEHLTQMHKEAVEHYDATVREIDEHFSQK